MPGSEKGKRKLENRSPQTEFENLSKKRMGEDMEFDVCSRLTTAMDDFKLKVSTTLTAIEMDEDPSTRDLRMWVMSLARSQVNGVECLANVVSEVVMEMHSLDAKLKEKENEVEMLKEELGVTRVAVKAVAATKEKLEIKASSKDMEEKLKVSISQFKVMDLNIGKETEDRKEICKIGMEEIGKKVRSDLKKEWDDLVVGTDVVPLARKTVKQDKTGNYTAPLLFTVADRNKRWKMEDILRSSKVYPGFHWPQEMLNVIKDYKTVLKDNGLNEETTYVRIRPTERDGRVRIRADVKPKEGNGKFSTKATWDAPPLCPEVRKMARDHLKPIWASGGRG
jgi:hypothetical protein